jgi:CCR4-NOT transcription complex subunit 4
MRRYEYFGQYGKIKNITLNKDNAYISACSEKDGIDESTSSNKSQISYAAYITYTSPQDVSLAILALDQLVYDNRTIRASYGRTKYCKFFLKNT